MRYHEPVFRPPSEWDSLILQVTEGCSWNGCHFCEMYKGKRFRVKDSREIGTELQRDSRSGRLQGVRRVFLADGDAMVLPTETLLDILRLLQACMPGLRRVSSYVSPRNLAGKTDAELAALRAYKLTRLYCGVESGNDRVLAGNRKGESPQAMQTQLLRAQAAGMELSLMILLGLGGREHSAVHARDSAMLMNRLQPYQLSLLVLGYPFGLEHYRRKLATGFIPLSLPDLLGEMRQLVDGLELRRSHFRCDHVSSFLPIQGVLSRDKAAIVERIEQFAASLAPSDRPYLPVVG